jgi:hypothetical protein
MAEGIAIGRHACAAELRTTRRPLSPVREKWPWAKGTHLLESASNIMLQRG